MTLRQFMFLVGLQLLAANGTIVNFRHFRRGRSPAGLDSRRRPITATPARWEVRQDQSAPTPPYVLAQVSNDPTDDRFPACLLDGMNFRDGEISVRIKPLSGREDQGGGVVWRYRDENNYYLVRANATNNTVAVFRVQHGQRVAIQPGVKHDVPANAWSILKVVARGNRYQVYVDHRRIMEGATAPSPDPAKSACALSPIP